MGSLLNSLIEYYTGYVPVQGGWIVPAIIGVGSLIAGIVGQNRQRKENRRAFDTQLSAQKQLISEQNEYNKPTNQMARFQEAGLNPHLIYGQGGPGNQAASGSSPSLQPTDVASVYQNLVPAIMQSRMMQSQVQATDAKTNKTYVETELNKLQARVLEKNPLLDSEGFKAIIDSLKGSAAIKTAHGAVETTKAEWFTGQKSMNIDGVRMHGPAGVLKMETELKMLEQRYKLSELDGQIKAEVIESKEFQNSINEVMMRWMRDGDITPQHIYQFIQSLLLKLL